MAFDIGFQTYMPCAAFFFREYDIPSKKSHLSLHKAASFCTAPLHKEVQHLFAMNPVVFRETAVQSSLEVMEEGQQYVRMESVEYLFYMNMVLIKERVGASTCKASYIYLDKAVNQLIEKKYATIQRIIVVK